MASERRYSDEEVSEILDRATEASSSRTPAVGGSEGLTLHELKEIGREVGISEEVITRAAGALDRPRPSPAPDQRFMGQTIGVGRTVELPRPLTDQEWNRLVVDLRETFNAKGKLSQEGSFRQWSNSNLQALLEPSGSGERLRLRTLKGSARSFQGMGAAFLAGGAVLGAVSFLGIAGQSSDPVLIATMGAAFFFASRFTVPMWARKRAREFEEILERVLASVESERP
jgi:hypothetical protein